MNGNPHLDRNPLRHEAKTMMVAGARALSLAAPEAVSQELYRRIARLYAASAVNTRATHRHKMAKSLLSKFTASADDEGTTATGAGAFSFLIIEPIGAIRSLSTART